MSKRRPLNHPDDTPATQEVNQKEEGRQTSIWTDGGPRPRKKVEGLRIGRTYSRGIASWKVENTHTSPVTRKSTQNRAEAVAIYEEWARLLKEEGRSFSLTTSERTALTLWRNFHKKRLVDGLPVLSLEEAIQILIAQQERVDIASPLITDAIGDYLNSLERKERSTQHIASTRSMLKLALSCFEEETRMADVDEEAAKECLEYTYAEAGRLNSKKGGTISANTFHHYYVALSGLWAWSVKRNEAPDNPFIRAWDDVGHSLTPERLQPGKEYTTPESLKKMLTWTLTNKPDMLPALAILAFAGLRPTEVYRLKWSDIIIDHEHGSTVHTTDIRRKTGYARIVNLCPAAVAWIEAAKARASKATSTHLIPYADDDSTEMGDKAREEAFRRTRKALINACPPEVLPQGRKHAPWPQDLLRHSYGTYYRAKTGSLAQTADQMGNAPSVCNKHYASAVPKAAGEAWFSVMPG